MVKNFQIHTTHLQKNKDRNPNLTLSSAKILQILRRSLNKVFKIFQWGLIGYISFSNAVYFACSL